MYICIGNVLEVKHTYLALALNAKIEMVQFI